MRDRSALAYVNYRTAQTRLIYNPMHLQKCPTLQVADMPLAFRCLYRDAEADLSRIRTLGSMCTHFIDPKAILTTGNPEREQRGPEDGRNRTKSYKLLSKNPLPDCNNSRIHTILLIFD